MQIVIDTGSVTRGPFGRTTARSSTLPLGETPVHASTTGQTETAANLKMYTRVPCRLSKEASMLPGLSCSNSQTLKHWVASFCVMGWAGCRDPLKIGERSSIALKAADVLYYVWEVFPAIIFWPPCWPP